MLATEPRLAIVWDEGYTLGREARLRLWFRALRDPETFASHWEPPDEELVQAVGAPAPTREQVRSRRQLLGDPRVLAWFWPFAREEPHGHPPLYALLGLAGDVLTPGWPDLERARLGPMLVFSLTAGPCSVSFVHGTAPGPPPSGPAPGSCSRTCSPTGTTPPTTPCSPPSGSAPCWRSGWPSNGETTLAGRAGAG